MSDIIKQTSPEELLEEMENGQPNWESALAMNTAAMGQSLSTPFLFVLAVNPQSGQISSASATDRPDVAKVLAGEFGRIWQEKIIPMAKAQASPIVRPDGRPFMSVAPPPDAPPDVPPDEVDTPTKKTRRPPRKR